MTSNPMVRNPQIQEAIMDSAPLTIQGAINKTLILIGITALFAYLGWEICAKGFIDRIHILMIISVIGGMILAFIAFLNPKSSHITAPAYAICEGILVGVVSFGYNAMYQGIITNALAITFLALLTMLFLYKTRVIQATPVFRKVVVTATIAIAIFYLVGFVASLLGHPMTVFNGGLYGIFISAVICVIAALNFILDFDFIERAENTLPDYFEWYAGLSLLVTVIWLYFEVLRLLAQLNKRN
ncbi:MAG: Bax inhibitor-1/YccA family protein [Candidatus Gastranaerophilales bacterium]|nr:Bax inhibitor-1/YccA family protein [Candidatus Gastranaerophilales bacterium]